MIARLQLAGPNNVHAGLDVHGDGSLQAFTGRWRRRPLETRPSQSAGEALRRALTGGG